MFKIGIVLNKHGSEQTGLPEGTALKLSQMFQLTEVSDRLHPAGDRTNRQCYMVVEGDLTVDGFTTNRDNYVFLTLSEIDWVEVDRMSDHRRPATDSDLLIILALACGYDYVNECVGLSPTTMMSNYWAKQYIEKDVSGGYASTELRSLEPTLHKHRLTNLDDISEFSSDFILVLINRIVNLEALGVYATNIAAQTDLSSNHLLMVLAVLRHGLHLTEGIVLEHSND